MNTHTHSCFTPLYHLQANYSYVVCFFEKKSKEISLLLFYTDAVNSTIAAWALTTFYIKCVT